MVSIIPMQRTQHAQCSNAYIPVHTYMVTYVSMCRAEFFVTETPKGKVVDPRKLALIKRVRHEGLNAVIPYIPVNTVHDPYTGIIIPGNNIMGVTEGRS